MYEVNLPVYNADVKEQFWVGFCLRGGRGINYNGITLADPKALQSSKPNVGKQCILDSQHISTIGVSPP